MKNQNRTYNTISHLLVLVCICINISTYAQENLNLKANQEILSGVFLTMPIEFPIIDNAALNTTLQNAGYSNADFAKDNYGIGIQFFTNRIITTLSYVSRTKTNDKNAYATEMSYRSFSVNFGYNLLKNTKLSIYPYLGYKSLGLDYTYNQKAPDDITFEEYLATPLDSKELGVKRANLDLGVGISLQDFYLLNFRLGCLLPMQKSDWRVNNQQDKLGNALKLNHQLYFSITIGLGNINKTKAGFGFGTEDQENIRI